MASALWRESIARSGPHGLANVGYLRRRPEPSVALHRSLWLASLPGWPRPLVLLVEANLWVRWTFFGAWRATWRVVRRRGAAACAADGVPIGRQARRVLGLALRWGVPPAQAYQFGLHVPPPAGQRGAADPALRYIFPAEAGAWHRHLNGADPQRARAVALLRDKSALARILATAGVPTVETLATWTSGESADFAAWASARLPPGAAAPPGVFFKLRDGHGALDAFAAWRQDGDWVARSIDGRAAHGAAAVQPWWAALTAHGDVLAQPRLATHPALAALAGNDDAITVRVITRRTDAGSTGVMAILEAPIGRAGLHVLWPIDVADGAVGTTTWDGRPASLLEDVSVPESGLRVPEWDALLHDSCRAHQLVGALALIAWDWVVTPHGARLLEGNSGWAVASPQRLFGPLARP